MWSKFKKTCHDCLARFVPDEVKKKGNNKWIATDIIHVKRRLKRTQRLSRRPDSVINLISTKLSKKIKQAKGRFFSLALGNFLREAPVKFWRFLCGTKFSSFLSIVDSPPFAVAEDTASEFNRYFHSVFGKKDAGFVL